MNQKYPNIVFELFEFLVNANVDISGGNADGRIASIEKEEVVIDTIMKRFDTCVKAPPRHWYDFAIIDNDRTLYFNVKLSTGRIDNANQKKGIIHSLTTIPLSSIPNNMNFNKFFRLVNDNLLDERDYFREYYYVYIDKIDHSVIIKSMLDIVHYKSNPCNFLQIDWKQEKNEAGNIFETDVVKIQRRIVGTIAKSLKQFIESSLDLVLDFYPELASELIPEDSLE